MLAQKVNFSKALTVNTRYSSLWVIDFGASDHMTRDATIFHEYNQCNENYTVQIADGSLSKVEGTSLIRILKDLTLNFVLHVPNLDCNLLSISKLTRDLNCVAKFFPNLCVFQDLDSVGRLAVLRCVQDSISLKMMLL